MVSSIEVRTATSGHLCLSTTQIHGTCTSTPLSLALRITPISPTVSLSAASPDFLAPFPSRALRSLPLSVMMSGVLYWVNGILGNRGTNGYFWASTPYSYTSSRYLNFRSTNVSPKYSGNKPDGFTLRCVAFQSSPQPSSFGYDVGHSLLGQWSSRQ